MTALLSVVLLSLAYISPASYAGDCEDLISCVETVSRLSGKQYIFPKSLNVKMQTTKDFKLNNENADAIFPSILFLNDLARIPNNKNVRSYRIIKLKDIKYEQLPYVSVDADHPPVSLPKSEDFYTLEYRFKNIDSDQSLLTVYGVREQLSKYGRVFSMGKTLLVHDTVPHLVAAYRMAKSNDQKIDRESVHKFLAHLDETKKYYDKKLNKKK